MWIGTPCEAKEAFEQGTGIERTYHLWQTTLSQAPTLSKCRGLPHYPINPPHFNSMSNATLLHAD